MLISSYREKKKIQLPTKPQRWQILGSIMKNLEIREWNIILPVYTTPESRHIQCDP